MILMASWEFSLRYVIQTEALEDYRHEATNRNCHPKRCYHWPCKRRHRRLHLDVLRLLDGISLGEHDNGRDGFDVSRHHPNIEAPCHTLLQSLVMITDTKSL